MMSQSAQLSQLEFQVILNNCSLRTSQLLSILKSQILSTEFTILNRNRRFYTKREVVLWGKWQNLGGIYQQYWKQDGGQSFNIRSKSQG